MEHANQTKPPLVKPHWLFWLVSIITLLWNLAGSANYIMQTSATNVAKMPDTYQALINTRPAWATAAFAITVFAAVIGSIMLLLKRKNAIYLFLLSAIALVGVLMQTVMFTAENPGNDSILYGVGSSALIAGFLLWFTKYAENKNWIG